MSASISLRNLLTTLRGEQKAASDGFKGVNSSHPSAKADNGDQDAKEGPRNAEHAKDLKDVPGPDNVQTVAEAKPDEQNAQQMNSVLSSKAVGTDAANERNYDTGHPDPGTSHPAKTDKSAFAKMRADVEHKANGLLAKIAAGNAPTGNTAAPTPEQKAAAAGYADAAKEIDAGVTDEQRKTAAAHVIGRAVLMGRLVGAALRKQAEEESESENEAKKDEGGEESEGGESSSPPSEGGGEPSDTDMTGGDPAGLLGAMQGGDPAGAAGGGGGDELQMLGSVLAEMGISPGELIAALQGGGAGGGMGGGAGAPPAPGGDPMAGAGAAPPPPGGDPMAGMDPTKMAAQRRGLIALASKVKQAAVAGTLTVAAPKSAAEAQLRKQIKMAIKDMIRR